MGEAVVRTTGFLDLCGYSTLTEHHGDAAAVEVVVSLRSVVRRHARPCGVVIVKWLGDGVMLAAEREDAVVECAERIRAVLKTTSPLRLRGGGRDRLASSSR